MVANILFNVVAHKMLFAKTLTVSDWQFVGWLVWVCANSSSLRPKQVGLLDISYELRSERWELRWNEIQAHAGRSGTTHTGLASSWTSGCSVLCLFYFIGVDEWWQSKVSGYKPAVLSSAWLLVPYSPCKKCNMWLVPNKAVIIIITIKITDLVLSNPSINIYV